MSTLDVMGDDVEGLEYRLRRRNTRLECDEQLSELLHTSTPSPQRRGTKRGQSVVPTQVTLRTRVRGRPWKDTSGEELSDSSEKNVEQKNKKKHKLDETNNELLETVEQVDMVMCPVCKGAVSEVGGDDSPKQKTCRNSNHDKTPAV